MLMEGLRQKRWLRIVLYVVIVAVVSVGFFLLFQYLAAHFRISEEGLQKLATTAYLIVFAVTLLSNAAVLVPVAYPHLSVIIAAATLWNPVIVASVASVAGALGEITAYYAGYLGKRVAGLEKVPGYQRLVGWMQKYGLLGIFLISVQPILPVDIAGLLAGSSRLALWKFLLPCWFGKFCKYLVACLLAYYLGAEVLRRILPLPF
jgi:membrane protein YqaA with SNARE-associated domain